MIELAQKPTQDRDDQPEPNHSNSSEKPAMFLNRYLAFLSFLCCLIDCDHAASRNHVAVYAKSHHRQDEVEPILVEFEADVMVYHYTLEEALAEYIFASGLLFSANQSFKTLSCATKY